MKNNKMLLIINPHSGRAKMRPQLLKVIEIFSSAGYEVTVYPTKCRGDATGRAAAIKPQEYGTVVVCGGDGTLNEVISGLMLSQAKCHVGYIPSGTLNEWSSGLHISRVIPKAAEDIVSGTTIDLDIGMFEDKYFCYTASFGAFTEASYSAPQDVKNVLGQAAYFFEGIKSLGNIKPIHIKVSCDGYEAEGDYLFGAVSNSMSVGGIVKFDDSAVKLNDGLFEVLLVKHPTNVMQLQSIIDGILKRDLNRDGIEFLHTKQFTVSGAGGLAWTLDGEFAEGSDVTIIKNISSAIRFIVPSSPNEQKVLS